jgi:RNA polymerase sigma-70 factor, ECF subfamily
MPRRPPAAQRSSGPRFSQGRAAGLETEALLRAIAGERDDISFRSIVLRYGPRLRAYFVRGGAAADAAEELVQNVLFSVWQKADRFDARKGSADNWLFAIARHHLLNSARQLSGRRPHRHSLGGELGPSGAPRPDELMMAEEDRQALQEALRRLPPEQAEVLRGLYFRGHSMSELALELHEPLGTVKTRARLAMARLRDSRALARAR